MPRQANAIDFWRGFALVTIFVNHIPGIYFERFTHKNYSISDSAELFVFLAGWSLRILADRPGKPLSTPRLIVRLGGRALTIYAAHILIISLAIAMLAASALLLENELLLEWHNAAAVFQDPVHTHIGLVLLTHQLGYFDILPLYVVLMLGAPLIAAIDRLAPRILLPLSIAIYLLTLIIPITIPTWPVPGQWFFNPLAWQLIFTLGFVLARESSGPGQAVWDNIKVIRYAAIPILIAAAVLMLSRWSPDPTKVPEPRLLFLNGKTFLTPMRLIQFLALAAAFSAVYPLIVRFAAPLTEFLSKLGRNSLNVFCVGSLLSLTAQIIRYVYAGALVVDTMIVVVGTALLWFTAWISERKASQGAKEAS